MLTCMKLVIICDALSLHVDTVCMKTVVSIHVHQAPNCTWWQGLANVVAIGS